MPNNTITLEPWYIFTGQGKSNVTLPEAPSWRKKQAKTSYIPLSTLEIKMINAALYLRRPLLITGQPGSGKSSLAKAVADELGMGAVLNWRITTNSTLQEGLYSYDALSRLQDIKFKEEDTTLQTNIEKYLKLEALGLAFASKTQRVVLIDEIDKSDIDLPNNLLHILEEQEFEIAELKRTQKAFTPFGDTENYETYSTGVIQANDNFPLIIMTSNGERDFPPAFMRRVLHLHIDPPTKEQLIEIVQSHFQGEEIAALADVVDKFITKRDKAYISTDQLLNAIYLIHKKGIDINDPKNSDMLESIWHRLSK